MQDSPTRVGAFFQHRANTFSRLPASTPPPRSRLLLHLLLLTNEVDLLHCLEPHKIIVPCTSTQCNKASRGCPRVAANCRVKNKHLTKLVIPTFILLLFDRISSSRRRLSPRLVLARRLRTPDPSARRSAAPRSPPRALISGRSGDREPSPASHLPLHLTLPYHSQRPRLRLSLDPGPEEKGSFLLIQFANPLFSILRK